MTETDQTKQIPEPIPHEEPTPDPIVTSIDDEVAKLRDIPKQNSNKFANVEYAETVKPSDEDEEEDEEIEDYTEDAEEVHQAEYQENENSDRNARLIFGWFDRIFSSALSWWAMEDNSDQFKAEKQPAKDVQESLGDWFNDIPDFKVPAWMGVGIGLPMAYGKKIKLAFSKRKFNKAAQKQAQKNKNPSQEPRPFPRKPQENTHTTPQDESQEVAPKKDNECKAFGCNKDKGKHKVYCSGECRTNMLAHRNKNRGK